MAVKLANNASSTLQGSINTSVTTISVDAGDASKFPTLGGGEWFPVTVIDAGGNMEIMRCTARTGATLTVTRAQEGTTAKSFAAGAIVSHRLTKAVIDEIMGAAHDASLLTTGTLPSGRLSGSYSFGGLSLTGTLTISNTAPQIKMIDTTSGQYSSRMRQDSNNVTLDGSTDDVVFTTVYRFEMDTRRGFIDGDQITTAGAGTGYDSARLGNQLPAFYATAASNALKAPLASPTFTGTPDAPTPPAGDNSTRLATTEFVQTELEDYAQFYSGSSASNTAFPIGSTIDVFTDGETINRNGIIVPALSDIDSIYYRRSGNAGAGAIIAGTWRSSGMIEDDYCRPRRTL